MGVNVGVDVLQDGLLDLLPSDLNRIGAPRDTFDSEVASAESTTIGKASITARICARLFVPRSSRSTAPRPQYRQHTAQLLGMSDVTPAQSP